MRVLIVDDESAARRRLGLMLEDLDVECVGEAEDGVQALRMIAERRPDLVLLDIAMPEVDGFDVARHLVEPKPFIVFQTAYDEYALKAFDHEALDYLVKPVQRDKLERALQRARDRIGARAPQELSRDVLGELRRALVAGRQALRPRLLVRERSGHRLLPYREIIMFRAEEGVVFAQTAGAGFLTDYTLRELEARTEGLFIRTSRAELVNLDHVRRFVRESDGSAALQLADDGLVRVARRRVAGVRQALEGGR